MKYLVYTALIFIGGLLFLPEHGKFVPRNLPLLLFLIACVLFYITSRMISRIITAYKIKRILEREHIKIKRFAPTSYFLCQKGRYNIVADSRRNTLNIVLIMRKNKYLRYHFDSFDRLEYYAGSRSTFKGMRAGSRQVSTAQTNHVDTTAKKGGRRLPFEETLSKHRIDIVIMDKFPRAVTDSVNRLELGNGDKICERIYLYDLSGFERRIKEII